MIRVYGFTGNPYFLPSFLTTRIFSLEYIQQIITMDDLHFVAKKLTQMFKVPQEIGPFLVKQRTALKVVEALVRGMAFE